MTWKVNIVTYPTLYLNITYKKNLSYPIKYNSGLVL